MKIKICGLTSTKEAEYLNENNVDFAGMVMFFPKSKRNINEEKSTEIINVLDESIKKVAVTVSPTLEQVKIIEYLGFDYIQIHGKLENSIIESTDIPILKAFNVKDIDEYENFKNIDKIKGFVFDAQEPGSGKTFDWNTLKTFPKSDKLMILAGGLNPDNVANAIKVLHPDCVDVSSGVENENGIGKSKEKINMFVTNARKVSR